MYDCKINTIVHSLCHPVSKMKDGCVGTCLKDHFVKCYFELIFSQFKQYKDSIKNNMCQYKFTALKHAYAGYKEKYLGTY